MFDLAKLTRDLFIKPPKRIRVNPDIYKEICLIVDNIYERYFYDVVIIEDSFTDTYALEY